MSDNQTTEAPARQTLHIDDEWELQRHLDRTKKLQELMAHERVYCVDAQLAREVFAQAQTLESALLHLLTKGRS